MKPFLYLLFIAGIGVAASGQCLTDFTKLIPEPSLNQTQSFGHSISMYDDLLVIGVPNNDSLGRMAGIVRIYRRANENWQQIASLAPSDARDAMQFGLSVKISKDYILVGSGGYPRKVYLYKKPPGGWVSQTEFTFFTVPNAVLFGLGAIGSIAISEDQQTIAITDPYYQIQGAPDNSYGAVFVFHKQPANEWSGAIIPVMIHAQDPDVIDFGRGGVVIHGDRLITTAPYTGSGPGAIFIFRDPAGDFANPVLEATLTSGPSTETFYLGYKNVAVNEDGIFASAVINTSTDGKVSVLFFEKPTSGVWADALPTCAIHSYDDAQLSGFVNLTVSTDGVYASHVNVDGSGSFTLLKKGAAGWCDPEPVMIDEFTPDPAQLIFSYGSVSTASQIPHAAVGFVPHPENSQAQLSLKVLSKEPDGTWSSQLIYPKEKSTSGHRYGNDILGFEDYLFVAAPYDGTIKRSGGAVYAYKKSGTAWQETGKILMPLKGRYDDVFGTALATNGTQLAVGATGYEEHGRVFIYEKRSADWADTELVQEIKLPEDILTVFSYGDNLAMNRDWLLIPYVQNSPAKIMVAIYKYNGSAWEYFQVVEAGPGNLLAKFTTLSVDIENETAVAGSLIIERNQTTGLWEPRYRLSPSDPEPMRISPDFTHWITNGAMFGHQVDISDNTIFVSAPMKDHGTVWDVGAVYVYSKKSWESWSSRTETSKILPRVKEERELFGYSLKALGNTLIVGAPGSDYNKDGATARNKPGRAYVFQSKDYFWQDVEPLIDLTGDSFVKDYFGMAVNLDESDFFIGAPIEDIATGKLSGSVYVTPAPPILMLVPPVCSNLNTVDLLGYPFGGTWSGPGIVDASEGIFDPTISGVGEHEFTYVTPSCTYEGKLRIRVEAPVEAKLNVEPEKLVCENSGIINVPVSVQAKENYRYQWYFRDNSADPFFPLNEKQASMNATQRGEYMAKVYNEVCQSFSPVVTIRNESVDLTLATVGKICQDDASGVELAASPAGGTWSGSGVSDNRFYSKGLPDRTYTLKYEFTSPNNCVYEEPLQVVVERMAVPAISRGSGNLCAEGAVTINAASAFRADVNYEWEWKDSGAMDFVPLDEGGPSTTVSARGSARLLADNGNCKTRSNVITIEDNTFEVNATPAEAELKTCNGDPVTISVAHAGSRTYQWYYQETINAVPELLGDQQTNSLKAGKSGYYHAVIYSGHCEARIPQKSVTIYPEESIFVPNVFTPNGDGFNDAFHIESNAGPLAFRITNRYGKLIYAGNSVSGWKGEGVPSGVYYWYIHHNTCEGDARILKGAVHLMR